MFDIILLHFSMSVFSYFNTKLSDKAQSLYELGNTYKKRGDYGNAVKCYKEALAASPSNKTIAEALGNAEQEELRALPKIKKGESALIKTTSYLSETYLTHFNKHGYLLDKVAYGGALWILQFQEKNHENQEQVHMLTPLPDYNRIKKLWEEGFIITSVAWGQQSWLITMTWTDRDHQQSYVADESFPAVDIESHLKDGYHLLAAVKGNVWFVYFDKNQDFTDTNYSFHHEFPDSVVQEAWDDDRYVTWLHFVQDENKWLIVTASTEQFKTQGYQNRAGYPLKQMRDRLRDGQAITTMTYGLSYWSTIYSGTTPTEEPKHQVEIEPETQTVTASLSASEIRKIRQQSNEQETFEQVIEELNQLTGLEVVKKQIMQLSGFIRLEKIKQERGLSKNKLTLHMVFSGNPGTGKTTVARLIGRIFKSLNILEKGHVVEVSRTDLVAEFIGQTAPKTEKVINDALDGILFIDEAYSLNKGSGDFGQEAIEVLLKRMEDDRDRLVVLIAGYTDEINSFIQSNPGLESRFKNFLTFSDYNALELIEILKRMVQQAGHRLCLEAEEKCKRYFTFLTESRPKNFGNARVVRNLFEDLLKIQALRLAEINPENLDDDTLLTIELSDVEEAVGATFLDEKEPELGEIMEELNALIGLESVKNDVLQLSSLIKIEKLRKEQGIASLLPALHSIFYGPPGTGKTTVARLMGKILKSLGLIAKGHVVEASRQDLVAGFVGQTAKKTDKIIDKALHGILFIDEAYSLVPSGSGNDFGREALEVILKRMEDDRDRLVVIMAGYPDEMNAMLDSNPGLRSRFNRYFSFDDYTAEQLTDIFSTFCARTDNIITEKEHEIILRFFSQQLERKDRNFGNARLARNLFEKANQYRASRISKKPQISIDDLKLITSEDIASAAKYFS